MDCVRLGEPLVATCLAELERLGSRRVFVLANRSCAVDAEPLLAALGAKDMLACPLYTGIVMGGAEAGVLEACNHAAAARADCVVTIGGGAVHDAGKVKYP